MLLSILAKVLPIPPIRIHQSLCHFRNIDCKSEINNSSIGTLLLTQKMSAEFTGGILERPRKSNPTFVVVSGSQSLAVKWETRLQCDVYHVHNVLILASIMQGFLQKQIEPTVVVIYEDLRSFSATLKVLYNLNETKRAVYQKQFTQAKQVYYGSNEHILAKGECDSPIAFKVYFMIPSKTITVDVLSNKSISAQLFVRVLSLKHGATVISHADDVNWLLNSIIDKSLDLLQPKPVAEESVSLTLLIPKGWDSWSKINILAKVSLVHGSIPQFAGDEEYAKFICTYDKYLEDETLWLQLEENSPNNDKPQLHELQHPPPLTLAEYLHTVK